MNKPLVERIDALRWRITNQRELSELDSILADVRELVDAAKPFDAGNHVEFLSGDFPCRVEVTAWHLARLSAILRKVGGE